MIIPYTFNEEIANKIKIPYVNELWPVKSNCVNHSLIINQYLSIFKYLCSCFKINSNLVKLSSRSKVKGKIVHVKKLKLNTNNGAIKNNFQLDFKGMIISLINNFNPSAIGCKRPNKPTTLGPFRR